MDRINSLKLVSILAMSLALGPGLMTAWAYDNVSAHPAINECALKIWLQPIVDGTAKGSDKLLLQYELKDVSKLRKLTGMSVTTPGRWHYDFVEGEKQQSFYEWVSDGGYTADEPEWFQSLRHFYDPTRPEGQRYLTDINTMAQWFVWMQKQWASPAGGGRDDIRLEQPRMDARHWALRGTDTSGINLPNNPYAWDRGYETMQAAFAETDPKKKDFLFARAWRILGEAMHLMADMTLPAHVRDDGHPLAPYAGPLRTDPYEDAIRRPEVEAIFKQLTRDPNTGRLDLESDVDQQLMSFINTTKSPEELFHRVAAYTNANFFSADTVCGTDPSTGKLVDPVVGRPYPSPRLEDCRYELGTYIKTIKGFGRSGQATREVLMLREGAEKPGLLDYLRRRFQDRPKSTLDSTYDCCLSQGRVLLPLAFAANAKLADWYIPRMVVTVSKIDYARKTLEGAVTHQPYGAYAKQLHFSGGKECVDLYINGRRQDRSQYQMQITRGMIEGDLSKINLQQSDKVALVVDMGGFGIRSQEIAGGAWVLFNKTITDKIKPSGSDKTLGNFRQVHQFKGSTTETSVNCSQTYIGERPKAETRGSLLTGPVVYARYLKQVFARNATWTLPPERLLEGEKVSFSLKFDTQGSEVVCDPPGAHGDKADVTGSGNLNYVVLLEPSKEQQAAWGAAPAHVVLRTGVNTLEQNKQAVWQVPGLDSQRHVLVVSIRFDPQVMADASYSARYEYKFQPASGK